MSESKRNPKKVKRAPVGERIPDHELKPIISSSGKPMAPSSAQAFWSSVPCFHEGGPSILGHFKIQSGPILVADSLKQH